MSFIIIYVLFSIVAYIGFIILQLEVIYQDSVVASRKVHFLTKLCILKKSIVVIRNLTFQIIIYNEKIVLC